MEKLETATKDKKSKPKSMSDSNSDSNGQVKEDKAEKNEGDEVLTKTIIKPTDQPPICVVT